MTDLASFDGTETARGELAAPRTSDELAAGFDSRTPCIARGAGLSYCGASAGAGVRSLSTLHLDRILDIDAETGLATVEPGVRVGRLLEAAVPLGWIPPVLPGHPMITVGGCIGFNVHGKSQRHGGNFIACVEDLRLFHPDHGEVPCSRERNAELFALTVGGFGLTGVVTRATLRLDRLAGGSIVRRRVPVADLLEAVAVMEAHSADAHTLYSWNDLNRRGDAFGHGFVYEERFAPEPRPRRGRFRDLAPGRRGPALFGRRTARLFGRAYSVAEGLLPRESRMDVHTAAFPINGREIYFALFGGAGFREYQMLVPRPMWESCVREVEALLARSPVGVTLGSLKLFDGEMRLLDFCGPGICLTLDVPATDAARDLFSQIDQLVLDVGGIANLSKDSRLGADAVRRMFPEYEKFSTDLLGFDPKRRFDSALRRRIGV